MSGWSLFVAAVVCASGAMLFLGIVARAVEGTEHMLAAFDQAERKARKRRDQAEDKEEPVVLEVAKAPVA